MGMVGIAISVIFVRFKSSPHGKRKIAMEDEWPVLGKAVRLNLFGQFARTLSTLLANGVPVFNGVKNH